MLKRKHKVVTVTYEDMVNQPVKMLSEIEKMLDVDLKSAINKIKSNTPLSVGMLFDGNRIRLKDEIVVQPSKSIKLRSIKDFIVRYIQFFLYKP
jgi:CxxC motif-containing protein